GGLAVLFDEGAGVTLVCEVAALPAPVSPRASKAVEDLPRVRLTAVPLIFGQLGEGGLVSHGAPKPGRNLCLLDALQAPRHAGFAEVFLRQNVGRHLAPVLRHHEAFEAENDGTVWVLDLAVGTTEWDGFVR